MQEPGIFTKLYSHFFPNKNSISASKKTILCENENVVTNPSQVADIFNKYYASIAEYPGLHDGLDSITLSEAINKHASHRSIRNITAHVMVNETFSFDYVSPDCVLFYISKLNVKKSGWSRWFVGLAYKVIRARNLLIFVQHL